MDNIIKDFIKEISYISIHDNLTFYSIFLSHWYHYIKHYIVIVTVIIYNKVIGKSYTFSIVFNIYNNNVFFDIFWSLNYFLILSTKVNIIDNMLKRITSTPYRNLN